MASHPTKVIIIFLAGLFSIVIMVFAINQFFPDDKPTSTVIVLSPNPSQRSVDVDLENRMTITPKIFRTITPQPTLTKKPTLTPTKLIQFLSFGIYDDFSEGSTGSPYNISLWREDITNGGRVDWRNGHLEFTGKDFGQELRPIAPITWRIDDIGRLQADLRIDSVTGGYAFSKMGIDTHLSDGKGTWWVQCRAGSFNGVNAQVICDSYRWSTGPTITYQSNPYKIEFSKFFTVAIEIEPDGSEVRYYLDGVNIGTYNPDVKDLLVSADFSWSVGIWMDNGVNASGAIDNVKVGTFKQ